MPRRRASNGAPEGGDRVRRDGWRWSWRRSKDDAFSKVILPPRSTIISKSYMDVKLEGCSAKSLTGALDFTECGRRNRGEKEERGGTVRFRDSSFQNAIILYSSYR